MQKNKLSIYIDSYNFGKRQLFKKNTLDIQTNQIVSILGRNGTGKSTLLKIIFGVIKTKNVTITINDSLINQSDVIKSKKIGYLPQNSFLHKNFKVSDVINNCFDDSEKLDKMFYFPGISSIEKKYIGSLSLGQLRFFEVLLLCHFNHSFLMLDEPFSMIDPIYIEKITDLLVSIKKEKGILLTDHYYDSVLNVSDKVLLLKEATFLKIESKYDLLENSYLNSLS